MRMSFWKTAWFERKRIVNLAGQTTPVLIAHMFFDRDSAYEAIRHKTRGYDPLERFEATRVLSVNSEDAGFASINRFAKERKLRITSHDKLISTVLGAFNKQVGRRDSLTWPNVFQAAQVPFPSAPLNFDTLYKLSDDELQRLLAAIRLPNAKTTDPTAKKAEPRPQLVALPMVLGEFWARRRLVATKPTFRELRNFIGDWIFTEMSGNFSERQKYRPFLTEGKLSPDVEIRIFDKTLNSGDEIPKKGVIEVWLRPPSTPSSISSILAVMAAPLGALLLLGLPVKAMEFAPHHSSLLHPGAALTSLVLLVALSPATRRAARRFASAA
jgi:hypothetical protein